MFMGASSILSMPIFLQTVQYTSNFFPKMAKFSVFGKLFRFWKILPKMENFAKNGKICQKWKNLPKMEKFAISGKVFQKWKTLVTNYN